MHNTKLVLHLMVVLCAMLRAAASPADVVSWKDPVSGNWTDPTKWSSAQVPGPTDQVVIDADGSYTITLNAVASIANFVLGRVSGTSIQTVNIVGGGTLSPNSASAVNAKGVLQISGGSLSGAGSVSVDGLLKWTSGTITGGGALDITASGLLNFGPGSDVTLDGRTLTNAGTATSLLTAFNDIFLRNNAVIANNGTFDIQGDNAIDLGDASSPQLTNAGTLRKSTSANTAIVDVHFVNSGTVETSSGTLDLRRSSLFGGTVTGSTVLLLSQGTHTFNGVTISGAGGVRMTGGTITTTGAGATVSTSGRLRVAGGTLAGSGPLSVDGILDWTAGTITGSGALNITASGVLNIGPGGDVTLDGRTLTNAGVATSFLTAFNDIFLRNNAVIANNGTFDIQGDNAIDLGDASSPQLTNAGTLKKSTSADTAIVDVHFVNTGTVEASSGTLDLRRTSLFGGTVTGSTVLLLSQGTHTFNGLTIAGAGGIRMTAGTIATTGAGATVSTSGRLRVAGGTLAGSGPLTVDGIMDWTAGTITGSGAFNITASGVLNIGPGGDVTLDGRTLTNAGSTTSVLTAFNDIFLRNNATIANSGTFDIQGDNAIDLGDASSPVFVNSGTVRRSISSGTATIDVSFSSTGTVSPESGTLNFTRGYSQSAGNTVLNGGGILSNGTLTVSGGKVSGNGLINANLSISGETSPGSSPGTLSIAKAYTHTAGSVTRVELGGLNPGTGFDQVQLTGSSFNAAITGSLIVELLPGFTPNVGDSFVILSNANGTVTGNFTSTQFPSVPGVAFQVVVGAKMVTLNAVAIVPTSTPSATFAQTATPTRTLTSTPSPTPVSTGTATPSRTLTSTPSRTATNTFSFTPTQTATHSATRTPTATTTQSLTPSSTATLTRTLTPTISSTATHTVPPPATSSQTPTATVTASATLASTATSVVTSTQTHTATATATPTLTATRTSTPSLTATHSPSSTPTATATLSPTFVSTATLVVTSTQTHTATSTATLTAPAARTLTPSLTATSTTSHSPTATVTETAPHTSTPTLTTTSTLTPTATVPTATATPSFLPTETPTPTQTATASTIPTATATVGLDDLRVTGACVQPGPPGLVGCHLGTPITAYRCNNPSCVPESLLAVGSTTSGGSGDFLMLLDGRETRGARLLFEALVDDSGALQRAEHPRGDHLPARYRALDFGPASTGSQLENVRLGPDSEAAVQLLAEGGTERYTDDGIRQVIAAVDMATSSDIFANQSPAAATERALDAARAKTEVDDILRDTRPFCLGDCNDDRRVEVDEIIVLVNIALGNSSIARCSSGNASSEAAITVDELIGVIGHALNSCPQ